MWLTLISRISLRFFQVHSEFPYQNLYVYHLVYIPWMFIHSSDGHLSCFYVLTILNNAAVKMDGQIPVLSPCFQFFYILLAHMEVLFNFLRNCQTVFHQACSILHFHQDCARIPIFAHPFQMLVILCFFDSIHSTRCGVVYFIVVCICISLMISHFLFMCLLAICISSLENEKSIYNSFYSKISLT